jgi:hypothetical protein
LGIGLFAPFKRLGRLLVDACVFLGDLLRAESFAVLFYQLRHRNSIHPVAIELGHLRLLHLSVPIDLLLGYDRVVEVILLDFLGFAFIRLNIAHQGDDVGKRLVAGGLPGWVCWM